MSADPTPSSAGLPAALEAAQQAAKEWSQRLHQMRAEGIVVTPETTTMPTALFDELRDWLMSLWVRRATRSPEGAPPTGATTR